MNPAPLSWMGPAVWARLTLLLNHIVSSEEAAQAKLRQVAGRIVELRWHTTAALPFPTWLLDSAKSWMGTPSPVQLLITPAGLFELLTPGNNSDTSTVEHATPHLTITVHIPDPLTLARQAMTGQRPDVSIEGDAALAEVASWLMKNLRWDIEDDLARWMGTTPAELFRTSAQGISQAFQRWQDRRAGQSSPTP